MLFFLMNMLFAAASGDTITGENFKRDLSFLACNQPVLPAKNFGSASGPRRELLQTQSTKWLNGTVLHYHFLPNAGHYPDSDGGDVPQQNVVRKAFMEWKNLGIGLSFQEEINSQKAQIKIGFDQDDGSWSYVGRDALTYARGPQDKSMNFGWDLRTDYGYVTALHEIGHALGFPHEHQSPFSGIVWNESAVYTYFRGHPNNWKDSQIVHNILSKLPEADTRGSSWDPDSVMHYSFEAGLISKPEKYQNQPLTPPLKLSGKDVEWALKFYPALPQRSIMAVNKSGNTRERQAKKAKNNMDLALSSFFPLNVDPANQLDFVFKPTATRDYTFETVGKQLDSLMVLFDPDDGMAVIQGSDTSGNDEANSKISASLIEGKEYLLKVRINHAGEGTHGLVTY